MTATRILVVDDEAPIVDLVRGYLAAEGMDVAAAQDGPSAVEAVRARRPDVIVLDVMLPGFDGFEVLRRVRTFSDAYVIMLTARAEEIDGSSACRSERTTTSSSRSRHASSSPGSRRSSAVLAPTGMAPPPSVSSSGSSSSIGRPGR